MKRYIAPTILICSMLMAWLLSSTDRTVQKDVSFPANPEVQVTTISTSTVKQQIIGYGQAQPRWQSVLRAEVDGKVLTISEKLLRGNSFQKGDILATIEKSRYTSLLRQAQAAVAQAELLLLQEIEQGRVAAENWQLSEFQTKATALTLRKPQLREARAKLASAKAGEARARYNLNQCQIIAPYKGKVLSRKINPGESLQIGNEIATIYQDDVLEVATPLSQQKILQLGEIIPGTPVKINNRIKAKIARVEQNIDSKSQWQKIIVEAESGLLPGQFVTVNLPGKPQTHSFVLGEEFFSESGKLWRVSPDNTLHACNPNILFHTGQKVYFTIANDTADTITVTRPQDFFLDGGRVTPLP